MKTLIVAATITIALGGVALAQSSDQPMNSSKTSPGTVGAMSNTSADGVATDPHQIGKDTGTDDKMSPGTVGAAPGTNAPSGDAKH